MHNAKVKHHFAYIFFNGKYKRKVERKWNQTQRKGMQKQKRIIQCFQSRISRSALHQLKVTQNPTFFRSARSVRLYIVQIWRKPQASRLLGNARTDRKISANDILNNNTRFREIKEENVSSMQKPAGAELCLVLTAYPLHGSIFQWRKRLTKVNLTL